MASESISLVCQIDAGAHLDMLYSGNPRVIIILMLDYVKDKI